MKRIVLIVIGILVTASCWAVEYSYVPLVREGVQWVNLWQCINPENETTDYCISAFEFRGTQEFNGNTYHKLYLSTIDKNIDVKAVADENEPVALMREDDEAIYAIMLQTVHGRYLNGDDMTEILAYDFKEPSNSFLCKYFNQQLLSTTEIMVDGVKSMKYEFSSQDVVEQVGYDGENTVLLPFKGGVTDGSSFGLAFVQKGSEIIYKGKCYADFLTFSNNNYSYVPLVREGVQWVNLYSMALKNYVRGYKVAEIVLEFDGVEIVDGVEYAKLVCRVNGNTSRGFSSCLMREKDKVVYLRMNQDCPEVILYDFNDMTRSWGYRGGSEIDVEFVLVDGKMRKKFKLSWVDVIEGIGANPYYYGDLTSGLMLEAPDDGSQYGLSHVIEHGDIVYEGCARIYDILWGSGDANGDGVVNGADVTVIYRLLLYDPDENPFVDDWPHTGLFGLHAADVNRDGYLNGADVTALYSRLLSNE